MNTNFINYVLLAIGIFTVLGAAIMIFLDKLKGEDMYFNLDVKEQEVKKVIEDAEEILSELSFTSDVIVKEIEDKINDLNKAYKNVDSSMARNESNQAVKEQSAFLQTNTQQSKPALEKAAIQMKIKAVPVVAKNKEVPIDEKPKTKQQMILELANQGLSIVEIAKKMNVGQGEVALILSLKNEGS